MQEWSSVDEVLDFAIANEIKAATFYTDLSGRVDDQALSRIFAEFAKEEQGHRAKLQAIKKGGTMKPAEKAVLDLKIGDYLVEADIDDESGLGYQDALILAMKREKVAFRLYSDLAASTDDANLRDVMLALAQEEAKHKLRFETEYDDRVLRHN